MKRITHKIKGKNIVFSIPDTLAETELTPLISARLWPITTRVILHPDWCMLFPQVRLLIHSILQAIYRLPDSSTGQKVLVALYTDLTPTLPVSRYSPMRYKRVTNGAFLHQKHTGYFHRIIAFTDSDNDSKYDPIKDQIAFLDT